MTLSVGAELFRSLAVRIIIRRWTRQRLKTLALLLVVALGVSVFLSIGLTNRAAVSSFGSFTEIVAGQSQYSVRSTIGSLAIEDARSVREALMDTEASLFPTLEVMASIERAQSRNIYKLVGVDLLTAASHFYRTSRAGPKLQRSALENMSVFEYLAQGNSVFAPSPVASLHQWQIGDNILVNLGAEQLELQYSGEIPVQTSNANNDLPVLVMDLHALAHLQ